MALWSFDMATTLSGVHRNLIPHFLGILGEKTATIIFELLSIYKTSAKTIDTGIFPEIFI